MKKPKTAAVAGRILVTLAVLATFATLLTPDLRDGDGNATLSVAAADGVDEGIEGQRTR